MRSLITILQLFDILFIDNTSLGLGPKGPALVRFRIIKKKKKRHFLRQMSTTLCC